MVWKPVLQNMICKAFEKGTKSKRLPRYLKNQTSYDKILLSHNYQISTTCSILRYGPNHFICYQIIWIFQNTFFQHNVWQGSSIDFQGVALHPWKWKFGSKPWTSTNFKILLLENWTLWWAIKNKPSQRANSFLMLLQQPNINIHTIFRYVTQLGFEQWRELSLLTPKAMI